MKKLVSVLLVAMFAFSFSACTSMQKEEQMRVKCPACGYEFDADVEPGSGR